MHSIEHIAPISYKLLGEEFFKKNLPLFFEEMDAPETTDKEILRYFPLYFKKNLKKINTEYKVQEFIVELVDFEFSKFNIINDVASFKPSSENATELFLNPMAQALRHEYDIEGFVKTWEKNQITDVAPNKTLLLLSKNPNTHEILLLKANAAHAGIIDELHDGKISKIHLLATLKSQYKSISELEWHQALAELKNNFYILGSE